jgi:hypothetical protein
MQTRCVHVALNADVTPARARWHDSAVCTQVRAEPREFQTYSVRVVSETVARAFQSVVGNAPPVARSVSSGPIHPQSLKGRRGASNAKEKDEGDSGRV